MYLGSFDVVVKVVSEGLNMGDGVFSTLWCEMSREQYCL